jgi:hypothetical protein
MFWLILIPIALIFVIKAIYCAKKRKNSRIQPSNMSINSSSPIIQPNSLQRVTINDPPPPYSIE